MPTLGKIELSADTDSTMRQLDVTEDVQRAVVDLGFILPTKPSNGFDPSKMPEDLTSLEDDQLTDLMHKIDGWVSWADKEMVLAKTKLDVARAQLEFLQSQVRLSLKASGERMTIPDKDDKVTTDSRICEAESRVLFCENFYEILKIIIKNAQGNWDTVSRVITQRGQALDRMRRGMAVVGQASPLQSPFRR